jgi:hypothetical protein
VGPDTLCSFRSSGAAILSPGGGEAIHRIQDVMYAKAPYSVLQRPMQHPSHCCGAGSDNAGRAKVAVTPLPVLHAGTGR